MSVAVSPVLPGAPRKRRVQRILRRAAGVLLCLILLAFAVHFLLVRQMRLPRLTLTQEGSVTAVAVTPDGRAVFSGSDPTEDALHTTRNMPADVLAWDAGTGRLLRRLPGFYWRSSGVFASPDGSSVAACGYVHPNVPDGSRSQMAVWDWRTGQKLRQVPGDLPLAFSPDGRFIGRENGVYNAVTGRRVCQISTRESIAEDGQCAFTPDGKWYGIIGGTTIDFNARNVDDGGKLFYSTTRLHFWRTDTGQEAKDYPFTRVRAFDIARDGHWLVMASDTGNPGGSDGSIVRCVDISTGKVLWTRERSMNGPDADSESVINSLAISPSGKYAVLLSIDSHLIVLDAGTGRELFRPLVFPSLNPPDWAIPGGLAFSADGQTLVSRCGRRVLVWDASSLQ